MKLEVLFENNEVVVLNKPSGLMVHPDGRSDEYTLADYVRDTYPEVVGVGEPLTLEKGKPSETKVDRPGIVHRLDRDTSGAIVIAKTQPAFLYLKRQFKEHTIKKVYTALVMGNVKQDTGIINAPISRSKSDFRVRTVPDPHNKDARGALRDATTRYKVIERYNTQWKGVQCPLTLVEVYPLTGRTHQIRTHFKAIRHPLLADPLYGPVRKREGVEFDAPRTMLHATQITFKTNESGEIVVKAPLPADFNLVLAKLR
ncbi:MAG: ribosomal large subunit pseudouridine synthase rRNA synthase [Candidatus Parcubacteria bacterium]|jgi:23S rRNA pseudouridine1911/1915/1917 synthase